MLSLSSGASGTIQRLTMPKSILVGRPITGLPARYLNVDVPQALPTQHVQS